MLLDVADYLVRGEKYLLIAEAQLFESHVAKHCRSQSVGFLLFGSKMICTVYFDDKIVGQTSEVDNEIAYAMLPSELTSQVFPSQ